jgi:uncharacterized protein YraI
MSRIASICALTTLGLFGLAAAAAAAVPGYTLPEANLRAGPGRDYPLISLVPPGRPAEIFGCVGGYGWCDVEVDGARGFISGRKLQVLYRSRRVDLSYYGPRLELPVVQFDIGTYWGQYYPNRPFYAERFRWQHGPDVIHSYGAPPPRPEQNHGYAPPPPRPEPEHGITDYNHPAPPVRPAHSDDHEPAAAHAAPSDHRDHNPATPPEPSQHSVTQIGPNSHTGPDATPTRSAAPTPAGDQNKPAPPKDHKPDHSSPSPGQPPQ